MGLPKRLTEMQMRFADLLLYGDEHGPLTKTEASKLSDNHHAKQAVTAISSCGVIME